MKGVVFKGNRNLELIDFPDPTPGPREVIIEVKASGICGSDLHFYRNADALAAFGYSDATEPIIGGHEPSGVIVSRGKDVNESLVPIGARVMNYHYLGCGHCNDCRSGWQQLCPSGFKIYGATAHGAHAQYMVMSTETIVALPDELTFSEGAAISCGTGTAFQALKRLKLTARDTLAVFGLGPVGASVALLAKSMGAHVIGVDISAERLKFCKKLGVDEIVNPIDDDTVAILKDLTRGKGVDLAVDCTGVPEARLQAVQTTRTWGTVCFLGEGGKITLDVSKDINRKQLTLIGSWTFSSFGQMECARYIADRSINLSQIFTDYYTLDEAKVAYEKFDMGSLVGKGVFEFL